MQNNKIIQAALLALMMLLSMWAVSTLLEVRPQLRNAILGVGFFMLLLGTLWRSVPLDAKLLFIAIPGYALGGKGFAYLSPAEPLFIGEICLTLCIFGLLLRLSRAGLFDTKIHRLIWAYLVYGGIHLIFDYTSYRLLAIRDSATVYYSLFFLCAYCLFQQQRLIIVFENVLKFALVLAIFSHFSDRFFSLRFAGFYPHADASIPLISAAALYFLVKGMERKSIPNLAIGSLAMTLMLISKTSATLSCAAVILSAILLGRVRGFVIPVVCIAAMSLLAFMIAAFINPDFISETLLAGDTAESFAMEDGEFTSGTSAWRWNWWMMIWDDTMRVAPIWGQGLGADISTPFLGATMGELVRYPHNIIFTVIGRLGLAGLFIFSTLFITIGILAMKFCIRYYNSVDRRDADLICCAIVIAGMVNGVLQSTYEVPHGAITHWVCLGYMVARYYNPVANNNTAQPEALKKM